MSSPQLDEAERGFSFSKAGPLDMRMDPTRGRTALELIRDTPERELGALIAELGEERHARKIARLIKEALAADRVRTTTDLAAIVATAIPAAEQRKSKIHPATRTFQALRIAVNGELDQLASLLAGFPDLLAPRGRCVIISFHSLEDRLVKHRFRDLAWTSSLPPQLAAQAGERVDAVCEPVTRKAVFAGDAELARNPRARSARLRACERTERAARAASGCSEPRTLKIGLADRAARLVEKRAMSSATRSIYRMFKRAEDAAPVRTAVAAMIVLACTLTAVGVIRVARQHEVLQLGYRLSRESEQLRELREARRRLELERATLTAPDRIRRLATELGMTPVAPDKIRASSHRQREPRARRRPALAKTDDRRPTRSRSRP